MSPTAVQPPLLALLPAPEPDRVTLTKRLRDLDRQRDKATRHAMTPDVTADLRETVEAITARLRTHPDLPLTAALYTLGRRMYVAGRMDQAADDQLAREQADRLAAAAITQTLDLIQDAS